MNTKMRNKFKIAIVAVLVAIAGYGVYLNYSKGHNRLTDLDLVNVEALAYEGETADGRKLYEHHCGNDPGTQCKALGVTGNTCPYERSCP